MEQTARHMLSRRGFVAVLAGGACTVAGLTGCENRSRGYYEDLHSNDDNWVAGFSVDTEFPLTTTTLTVFVDERFKTMGTAGVSSLQSIYEDYPEMNGRENIEIKTVWCSPDEVAKYTAQGFPENADGFIGLEDDVLAGIDSGVLYGGIAGTSRRDLGTQGAPCVFRKVGSGVDMSKAEGTLDGEDQINSNERYYQTKMMQLAKLKGKLAIGAEGTWDGISARDVLNLAGLYSEALGAAGGTFSEEIRDKIAVCNSTKEIVAAVKSGECSLGLMLAPELNYINDDKLEAIYSPDCDYMPKASGASVSASSNGGVVRDMLQYMKSK